MGLALAVVVIFLLLAANFQSLRLSLAAVSTVPAAVAGVVLMLYLTRTTLNIQSFIGAIMAVGVAMANAILLVTFAENRRRGETGAGRPASRLAAAAAVEARQPAAAHFDDHLRDDGGHAADGAGLGRIGAAERAAGPGRHRRPGGGDGRHLARPPVGFRPAAIARATQSASLDPFDPASSFYEPPVGPGGT